VTEPFHWFVLGGGLSPYTLDLWEAVGARSNQAVTLAHVPREQQLDFAHEGEFIRSKAVELVAIESPKTIIELAIRIAKAPRAGIVCMGHSPIYNVLVSAIARATGGGKRLVLYVSDTNGVELAERSGMARFGLPAKRAVLGHIFSTSLDLGFSNALAHRQLGIRNSIEIPLLPIAFPESMEAEIPEPLGTLVRELPRPRLLAVARLVKSKNLIGLVEAFSAATQEGMPGSLTIIGEGPERSRIDPILCRLQGRAVLAGPVPFNASRRLFGAFDGMLMMSTFEPWGIVIIEGLGWGVPVLSSRQCGAGVSLAFETGDAVKLCGTTKEEMKSSLMDFVRNLDRHTIAAKAAAPMVRRKFGMTEVADALIKLGNDSVVGLSTLAKVASHSCHTT
jgi:glycosyltransferase involved in cell wall biosynthesis